MFDKQNVLIHLLFLIVQESTFAEWIEVPQFSNGAKVYRIPSFTKYETGQKYFLNNRDGPKIYEYGNSSDKNENFHRPFNQHYEAEKTTKRIFGNVDETEIVTTVKNVYSTKDYSEIIVTKSPQNNEQPTDDDDDDDAFVENEEDDVVTVSTIYQDDKIVVNGDQAYQTIITDENQSVNETVEPEIEDNEEKTSFLAYIPLELFKKVHAILKSQSTTVEGKMNFLKRFEKALLAEIETRLVSAISPVRKKRESRGDHGWDDHDDSVGFPSLEGALMAISFLTFAVYLVQLVMMLFRNLGNNTNTAAGTATVLFNRNKRSTDEFNEDTARILDYLDKFARKEEKKKQTENYE